MPNRTYSPELKRQILAEAMLGEGPKPLAKKYNMPEATIRNWIGQAGANRALAPQEKQSIDQLAADLATSLLVGLRRASDTFGSEASLHVFRDNGSAHLWFGVAFDKLLALLASYRRGADERDGVHTP